ncbi:MAG: alkylation response protein AidB-like acyl-CoA dehydrogenase [Bradymonadia bacterium]|jgi:alkylation response protein AidB-like acyl-CoA dehydrogenase
MSHLIFDKRDWNFLSRHQFDFEKVLSLPAFEDFDTETCEAIFDEAVKFAQEELAPLNSISDRVGAQFIDGEIVTPPEFTVAWKKMRAQGWNGAIHSTEWGGQGLPFSVATSVFEVFSGACQAFDMFRGLSSGAGHLIESFGTDELKALFVEKMYSGEFGGTMCLTEPQAGSAVGDATTSATPNEDGTYNISGGKIFISAGDAPFYSNTVHLVLARIKGDPESIKGISLFAVPKHLMNEDGTVGAYNNAGVTGIEHKMGINGSPTCTVSFGDGGDSKGWLVGERCSGIVHMFQMMNEARIACGLQGVAMANAAYQQALAYAKDRKQGPDVSDLKGPSVEIIRHPDVRRNLMFMKTYSEGTRALVAKLAVAFDFQHHSSDKALVEKSRDIVDLLVPIVKAYSTDKAFKVCELAVQVFGGYGYCSEYPVEQYLRDTKISSIYEGTNGIQALDLLGRKMRMKGGALFMGYVMELTQFLEGMSEVEELTSVHKLLSRAQASLGEVGFWLAQTGGTDRSLALLQATPFLEVFGDVVVGHLLAEQAQIALDLLEENGARTPTAEQLEDEETAYLWGKVLGARFFAAEVVSLAPAKVESMTHGERAALDMPW